MRLFDFLCTHFLDGIQYEDAVGLCMAIYCQSGILPKVDQKDDLTMSGIAESFARIAKLGLIKNYSSYKAILYGANYHAIEDKGHWVEIQASILKLKTAYDVDAVKKLLETKSMGSP